MIRWEARFKSIAILDEEALLTTLAYVDLNPLAAGLAKIPEQSAHTSVKTRVDHCHERGMLDSVTDQPNDRTRHDVACEDESLWLVPIQDRREHGGERKGVTPNMNLASYLRLLDWSSRFVRRGKARVPKEIAGILDRLGSNAGHWQERMEKLAGVDRIYGVVFATRAVEISRFAESRGVKKLSNLNGCSRRT